MPQKRKPPRLQLRSETRKGRKYTYWVIRDGETYVRTGCTEDEASEAEAKFREYLGEKHEPVRGGRATEVTIGDILLVYDEEKADGTSRPKETRAAIGRLNEHWGAKVIRDINGAVCREFADARGTESGARRDLEIMRAATNHYHREHGLDIVPAFTLPEKGTPRESYLTRQQAARLLLACLGWQFKDGKWTRLSKIIRAKRRHLIRLVLLGIYTGTRAGATLKLQWIRSTTGGWADMERKVIFRRAEGERVAHNKRKTPVKIARRLAAHMERWKRKDGWTDEQVGLRYIVHYHGKAVHRIQGSFRQCCADVGLDDNVVLHTLRHTRGTWLAQKQVPPNEAAASLGLTVDEYERTYLHNDPDFQKNAADAY